MTYPDDLTLVTFTTAIVAAGGRPLAGNSVTAVPVGAMLTNDGAVLPYRDATTTDAAGRYTFSLPAVDDPKILSGVTAYLVTEHAPGGRTFHVAPLMSDAPGPVDVSAILVEKPQKGGDLVLRTGPVTDETAAGLLDLPGGQFAAALSSTIATEADAPARAAATDVLSNDPTVAQAAAQRAGAMATDPLVAGAVDTPGSDTRTALDGRYTRRAGAAESVLDHGATGDPGGDDTAAILAAIATGRPVALIPGATHNINTTLNPTVLNGNGATLRMIANQDVLTIGPHTKVSDLNIKIAHTGYDKTALALDGTAGFNVLSTTELTNITLDGPGVTAGVAIGADDQGAEKWVVTFVKTLHLRAHNWKYGVRLANSHAQSWMNGNVFDVSMYNVAHMMSLEGICDANELYGQLQYSAATVCGVKCAGFSNQIAAQLWDYSAYPAATTYDLRGGSYNKVITNAVARSEPLYGANPTNEVNYQSRLTAVFPKVKDRSQFTSRTSTLYAYENFLGQQDDILKMAHRRYAVTSTVAPTVGPLSRIFMHGGAAAAWSLGDGESVTITIDCSTVPLQAVHVIGILFAHLGHPDALLIETENATGTRTVAYRNDSPPGDPLQFTRNVIAGAVNKIHVTLTAVAAKTIRVGSIFASSGIVEQSSFVQTNGGTVWGSVEHADIGTGPIVKSPGGARYRLGVDNDGVVTATAL